MENPLKVKTETARWKFNPSGAHNGWPERAQLTVSGIGPGPQEGIRRNEFSWQHFKMASTFASPPPLSAAYSNSIWYAAVAGKPVCA